MIGLGVDIPAVDLTGNKSYLYLKWLIYFFQFQWIEGLAESFQYISYYPTITIVTLIAIIAFAFILVAAILFFVGGGMAFGSNPGSAGMTGAIFFAISVGLNMFSLIYGVSSTPDPYGMFGGMVGQGILMLIDTNAIIIIVLSFVGAGLIASGKSGF